MSNRTHHRRRHHPPPSWELPRCDICGSIGQVQDFECGHRFCLDCLSEAAEIEAVTDEELEDWAYPPDGYEDDGIEDLAGDEAEG